MVTLLFEIIIEKITTLLTKEKDSYYINPKIQEIIVYRLYLLNKIKYQNIYLKIHYFYYLINLMACDFKQVINSPLYSKPHIKGMYFLLYNFSNILMNNVFLRYIQIYLFLIVINFIISKYILN